MGVLVETGKDGTYAIHLGASTGHTARLDALVGSLGGVPNGSQVFAREQALHFVAEPLPYSSDSRYAPLNENVTWERHRVLIPINAGSSGEEFAQVLRLMRKENPDMQQWFVRLVPNGILYIERNTYSPQAEGARMAFGYDPGLGM